MMNAINSYVMPMSFNHDPRFPPLGRISDARIVERSDGEYELIGTIETYDEVPEYDNNGKKLAMPPYRDHKCHIMYDRSYRDDESMNAIREIAHYMNTKPQFEVKKALEPISILTIIASIAIGSYFKGFFGKLGEANAQAIINNIKKLVAKKEKQKDRLVVLKVYSEHKARFIEVNVIASNPIESDVDVLFSIVLKNIDEILPEFIEKLDNVRILTYLFEENKLYFAYAVRDDGIPLLVHRRGSKNSSQHKELFI